MVFALIAALVLSMVLLLWASSQSAGPKRRRAQSVAVVLLGVIFLGSAMASLRSIHSSERLEVTGRVRDVVAKMGKRSTSSFTIVRADGGVVAVSAGDAGNHLGAGDRVTATVLAYHDTLLKMRVLDGASAGWETTEGDGTVGASIAGLIGAVLMLSGLRLWTPNAV